MEGKRTTPTSRSRRKKKSKRLIEQTGKLLGLVVFERGYIKPVQYDRCTQSLSGMKRGSFYGE